MNRKEKLLKETRILEHLYPSLTRGEIIKISDKDVQEYSLKVQNLIIVSNGKKYTREQK